MGRIAVGRTDRKARTERGNHGLSLEISGM